MYVDGGTLLILAIGAGIGGVIGGAEYHGDDSADRLRQQIIWAVIGLLVTFAALSGAGHVDPSETCNGRC